MPTQIEQFLANQKQALAEAVAGNQAADAAWAETHKKKAPAGPAPSEVGPMLEAIAAGYRVYPEDELGNKPASDFAAPLPDGVSVSPIDDDLVAVALTHSLAPSRAVRFRVATGGRIDYAKVVAGAAETVRGEVHLGRGGDEGALVALARWVVLGR